MHQHMNDGTAWVYIVICASKNRVKSNCFCESKNRVKSKLLFKKFVRKDSEEDIETNIFI